MVSKLTNHQTKIVQTIIDFLDRLKIPIRVVIVTSNKATMDEKAAKKSKLKNKMANAVP